MRPRRTVLAHTVELASVVPNCHCTVSMVAPAGKFWTETVTLVPVKPNLGDTAAIDGKEHVAGVRTPSAQLESPETV